MRKLIIVLLMLVGCNNQDVQIFDNGDIVPAVVLENIDGHAIAARYWIESKVEGKLDIFELHPGNVIYRSNNLADSLNYGFDMAATQMVCDGGSCLPTSNSIRLYTDQTKVTFVDKNGACYQNGHPGCNFVWGKPCDKANVFCAPLQIVSNYTFGGSIGALPDVVMQIANTAGGLNTVNGCYDNSSNNFGICATTGTSKVDSPYSNLTSPITGAGFSNCNNSTCPCSYCYGNQTNVIGAGVNGLQNVVMSGLNSTMAEYNTDVLALQLDNANGVGITLTIIYALPKTNATGTQLTFKNGLTNVNCVTPGVTIVSVAGGGFGPPGSCFSSTPPTICPVTASIPLPTYQILFPASNGGTIPGTTNLLWKDTQVSSKAPLGITGGVLTIITPLGNITTTDTFSICQ